MVLVKDFRPRQSQKLATFVLDPYKTLWHGGQTMTGASVDGDSAAHLLDLIRREDGVTRGQLALLTGLARSTIAQRVDRLHEAGLLLEMGGTESTGGRPPSILTFNKDAGIVLCADLGATHSRLAVTNLGPDVLAERTAEIDINEGPETVLSWLEEQFEQLVAESGSSIGSVRGIGVGLPGPVDFDRGVAVDPPIMAGWHEYPVAKRLRDRFEVPVLVDNDVNIMAVGEHACAEPQVKDLVFVKVGTGIGSGLVLGGRLHRGDHGAAGDIGHVQAGDERVVCRCGNSGCLEALAGGAALSETLGVADTRAVVNLTKEGDKAAVRAVRDAGRLIGHVLATTVNLLNPQLIVLGGDLAKAEQQLLAGIREVVYQRSTTLSTQDLRIVTSALGERAGIFGASSMVIDHVLAPSQLDVAGLTDAVRVG